MEEEIIIRYEFEIEESIKKAAEYRKEIEQLKNTQKELNKEGKIGTVEFEENAAKLKQANVSYREATKETEKLIKAKKEEAGSVKALRAEIDILTIKYNKMSQSERESAEGKAFAQGLENKVKKLKEAENAIGDYRRNVGNYKDSIKEALSATNTFGGGMSALSGIMKLAPFGIILIAIEKLFSWFSKLQPVMDSINEIMGGLSEVMEVVAVRASNLVDAVSALFSGDFDEANKKYMETFYGLADAMGEAYTAGVKYAQIQKQIDDSNQILAIQNANAEKAITSLTLKAKDRTKSEKERLGILDQITNIEKSRFAIEERNLKLSASTEEIRLKNLLKQRGANLELIKTTEDLVKAGQDYAIADDILKKVVDSAVALTNAERESINITERAQARRNALLEEEKANREKAHADYLKKLEERRKKEEEFDKKRYEDKKALLEVELSTLEEGSQLYLEKQIQIAQLERDQKLKDEKLTVNQKALINAQYVDKVLELQKNAQKIQEDNLKASLDKQIQTLNDGTEKAKLAYSLDTINRKQAIDEQYANGKISALQYQNELFRIEEDSKVNTMNLRLSELEEKKKLYAEDSIERLRIESETAELIRQINLETGVKERQEKERTMAMERQKAQAQLQIAQSTFGNLASLFEEGSDEYKAFALLQAGASTAQGAIGAFSQASSAFPPPAGQIIGAIAAAAVVATGIAQMNKIAQLEDGGMIFPKAAKGMILGGQPHSRGGTKFIGSDGTRFEAEKGELLAVVNKRSTRLLNGLNWLNQLGGGINFFENGGLTHLADGGFAIRGITAPVDSLLNSERALNSSIINMPQPIVLVEDINSAQGVFSKVKSRAEI